MQVNSSDHPFGPIYSTGSYDLWQWFFTPEFTDTVERQTGLRYIGKAPDWDRWQFGVKGISWRDLIGFVHTILRSEATRRLCAGAYVHNSDIIYPPSDTLVNEPALPTDTMILTYNVEAKDLPEKRIGTRRIQACFYPPESTEGKHYSTRFLIHGRNDSCPASGSWPQWVQFAFQCLSSENTKECAPKLYAPGLGIE